MCFAAHKILTYEEYELFNTFYENEVRKRTTFFYKSGDRVNEDDLCDELEKIGNYYLFEPYNTNKRVKWLKSKIKKLTKDN